MHHGDRQRAGRSFAVAAEVSLLRFEAAGLGDLAEALDVGLDDLRNSSGVERLATAPTPSRRLRTASRASTSCSDLCILSTIGCGVPAGNTSPYQPRNPKPAMPLSATVGTFGIAGQRIGVPTASSLQIAGIHLAADGVIELDRERGVAPHQRADHLAGGTVGHRLRVHAWCAGAGPRR